MTKPDIAVLGNIPPDMRAAMEAQTTLFDPAALDALEPARRERIALALTSAIIGAPEGLLATLSGLRRIASIGAGVDRYDIDALAARGIEVCATPEVMTEDTADMAVGLVFAVLRRLVENDAFVRRGDWSKGRAPPGRRVSGRRVGIVGLGRIGARVAAKLHGVGCGISYTGRSEKPGVPWAYLPDPVALAAEVDVLVLTCAGGAATRHLVNRELLQALGCDGIVVNVSRGSVVDEAALLDALESGAIAGAGLDVYENEPEPDAKFLSAPNLVLQPHAAVLTAENRVDLAARLRELLLSDAKD